MENWRRGRAWTIIDRYGNQVYLTWERWEHVIEFHPEMEPFFEDVRLTVQGSRRRQDALNPYKWFYVRWRVQGLELWNNCIVVVVIYRPDSGRFVVTAYQDYVRER
jgi:hypothetical protein